jgi:hypothetical protein
VQQEQIRRVGAQLRAMLPGIRSNPAVAGHLASGAAVTQRYQPVFSKEQVKQITAETFVGFLRIENNRHWALHRQSTNLTSDMAALRRALGALVDESRPLAERYDEATGAVTGMGRAIASGILLMAFPQRCGVWNSTSQAALEQLGVYPEFDRGMSEGAKYVAVNDVLKALASEVGLSLSDLDIILWGMMQGSTSSSALHRTWGIYVGNAARHNFGIAREKATWGADDVRKFDDIQPGDRLVFIHNIKSDRSPAPDGFPRVADAKDFSGTVEALVFAEVTSAPFESKATVWPDAPYPARFTFREVGAQERVPFSVATFPTALVDAARTSATSTGRPRFCELPDIGPWSTSPSTPPVEPDPVSVEPEDDPQAICSAFAAALRAADIRFGDEHDDVVRTFVTSLMAKPFVILTGLSGSGKTQIALKLGEWFGEGQWKIVPVRPDWTGPEFLLGYEDALRATSGGRRAWTVPPALEFFLEAAAQPDRPYLLILDEMNLAHVERYFADVLSGIESRAPVLPDLERTADGWYPRQEGGKIPLPRNLFIVGTVNVDETTYLFSPKVLDRANTLEFRVASSAFPDDPRSARKPSACAPGPRSLVAGLLHIARDDQWHQTWLADATETVAALRAIHDGLSAHGAEFGHRTFYEGVRLMGLLHAAGVASLDDRLDVFVLQKVLPRLHGARRKLEPIVRGIGAFAFDRRRPQDGATFDPAAPPTSPPRLPRSFKKLQRMTAALRANQFASFSD